MNTTSLIISPFIYLTFGGVQPRNAAKQWSTIPVKHDGHCGHNIWTVETMETESRHWGVQHEQNPCRGLYSLLGALRQKLSIWGKDKIWEAKMTDRQNERNKPKVNNEKYSQFFWATNVLHGHAEWKSFIGRLLNNADILLFNRC